MPVHTADADSERARRLQSPGPLRVLSVGLGPIGLEAARLLLAKETLELVGAVDLDPEKAGRDLAELASLPHPTGIAVEAGTEAALRRRRPDAMLLCTASSVPAIREDLLRAARAGVDVVSSCEELLLPELRHPALAREIHEAAMAGGATVLGTGVNPGFVLDFLPAVVSAACRELRRVRGLRVVDAASRRLPLQRKVGAGLSEEEFRRRARQGRIGHVGLRESVALLARGLGFELDAVEETLDPVIAERDLSSPAAAVPAGRVAGLRSVGTGVRRGEVVVELRLEMYLGAPDPRDELCLDGDPPLRLRLPGGLPGDAATAAILVNSLPQVVAAPPGLTTVLDLPPPRFAP